ncbi:hypothetical protein KIK06_11990 [Nocardiopsis sp. EMB25]|uniref:hypothetical protein n=1 Tax=Nocardiopsis TaxID=2013 RepID=UPI00034B5F5B|nr:MULTISPECIES: hypothetical protein [Nocardiopsis]MCY9784612.1 hypothetical protein [Nocardiopsis sp. EMB25]
MGVYVAVRGWLECDEKQLVAVREVISSHEDGHHSHGWGLPRQHVNWTRYVFYGADVRASALDGLVEQMREIARIPASDDDGDRVTGLFLVSHEVDGMTEWQLRNGRLVVSPGDDRYRYLDE